MQLIRTYIFFLGLILLSSFAYLQQGETDIDIKVLTTQTIYEAGSNIDLKFSSSEIVKPLLYCSNSYGSTLVNPMVKDETIQYQIPQHMSNKIGVINWQLLNENQLLSGQININPKPEVATMETYIGPPSIEAGGTDYIMLVVIPTDSLDNPVEENTLVNAKHQFLSSEKNDELFTKNLIAYKNLFSQKESGRMLVSSESSGSNSKEFTINVTAAIPTDFTISAKRPHDYADGNQITTFKTSIIKDKHNNAVSDGTFVTFFITNSKGNILKTTGTTISGFATSMIIHPDHEDNWSVKAFIDGMAESNTITLNYKQVIQDLEVTFSENKREITIGPLQSFMKQMIPDGLQVKLLVYKDDSLIETHTKNSNNGFVRFKLKPNIFENGNYNLLIQTAGLEKTFNSVSLW